MADEQSKLCVPLSEAIEMALTMTGDKRMAHLPNEARILEAKLQSAESALASLRCDYKTSLALEQGLHERALAAESALAQQCLETESAEVETKEWCLRFDLQRAAAETAKRNADEQYEAAEFWRHNAQKWQDWAKDIVIQPPHGQWGNEPCRVQIAKRLSDAESALKLANEALGKIREQVERGYVVHVNGEMFLSRRVLRSCLPDLAPAPERSGEAYSAHDEYCDSMGSPMHEAPACQCGSEAHDCDLHGVKARVCLSMVVDARKEWDALRQPPVPDARALAALLDDLISEGLADDEHQLMVPLEMLQEWRSMLPALSAPAPPESPELAALKEAADDYHEAFWAWDRSDEDPECEDGPLYLAKELALDHLQGVAFVEAATRKAEREAKGGRHA